MRGPVDFFLTSILMLLFLAGCRGFEPAGRASIKVGNQSIGVSVHDPSIVRDRGKFYIFGSHMEAALSGDMQQWRSFASGTGEGNRLFDNLFSGDKRAFAYVGANNRGGYSVWAPDVIYNPAMGKYMMYFCTTSSYVKSNLCFALSDSIEGPYHYIDTILYSGFTKRTIGETDVEEIAGEGSGDRYCNFSEYANTLWPNAIDPALFFDGDGRMWMAYGSWSGGIFLLEIDKNTGYPIHPAGNEDNGVDPYFGTHLAGGFHNSVEGPCIIYDKISGWYYLFVSYGGLVSEGGYQIRLFRSESPDGPYLDKREEALDREKASHSPYGIKLMGNYSFPSLAKAYMAPGHNSALIGDRGEIFLVHHTRFDDGTEYHEPRVRRLFRTSDGWLTAAPFAFNGSESPAEGLTSGEIQGSYFILNHGTAIGPEIIEAEEFFLGAKGTVINGEGKKTGNWSYEKQTARFVLTMDRASFTGLLIEETDEAGNKVLAFTALSDGNESLWGVHYR